MSDETPIENKEEAKPEIKICGRCSKPKGETPESCNCGRPCKFGTIGEVADKINAYFADTPKEEWTITGLALALDTTRQTLLDYEEKEEFADTIKKAKLKVENSYELDLKKSGRTGTIFALKNFNWKDKTETDLTSKGGSIVPELNDEQFQRIIRARAKKSDSKEVSTGGTN